MNESQDWLKESSSVGAARAGAARPAASLGRLVIYFDSPLLAAAMVAATAIRQIQPGPRLSAAMGMAVELLRPPLPRNVFVRLPVRA